MVRSGELSGTITVFAQIRNGAIPTTLIPAFFIRDTSFQSNKPMSALRA